MSDQSSDQQQDDDDGCQDSAVDKESTTENSDGDRSGDSTLKRLCFDLCTDVYFPRRYIVVLLLFVGLCVVHAQRVNVGVAVVSIVDSRHRVSEIVDEASSNSSAISFAEHSVRRSACCFYIISRMSMMLMHNARPTTNL